MSIFTNNAASSKAEAREYTAALIGLIGEREPLAVLQQTEVALREEIAVIDAARLSKPEAPGKWSVRQVLAHLADSEIVFGWRLRMALAHDRPDIQGYDQDLWAARLHYQEAEPGQSIETFAALRRWNLRLLLHASAEELARFGVHSERGEESVAHMIRLYAGHDTLHLRQIARILEAVQG
jgi:DinB superfamily